jgi:hypothetical protein
MIAEKTYRPISGWGPLLITLALFVAAPWLFVGAVLGLERYGAGPYGYQLAAAILVLLLAVLSLAGFMAIAPTRRGCCCCSGSTRARRSPPASSG